MSHDQLAGPPSGATTSNLSWWRKPNMLEPIPPIETPMTARCVILRLRVFVPASLATMAW